MSSISIESAMKAGNLQSAPVNIQFARATGLLGHKSVEDAMAAITSAQNLEFSNNVQGLAFAAEQANNADGKRGVSTQPLAEIAQLFGNPSGTLENAINEAAILTQITLELTKEGLENYERLMKTISEMWKTGTVSDSGIEIDNPVGTTPVISTSLSPDVVPIKDENGRTKYEFSSNLGTTLPQALPTQSSGSSSIWTVPQAEVPRNQLVSLPSTLGGVSLERGAATDLERMLGSLRAETGVNLWVVSGFRSVADQQTIWDRKLQTQTPAQIERTNARPGFSEHHTGRAVNLALRGKYSLSANEWRSNPELVKAFQWLNRNASKFGFLAGNSTGVNFEPWHWMHRP